MKKISIKLLIVALSVLSIEKQSLAQWNTIPTPNNEVIGSGVVNSLQRSPDISALNTAAYTYSITWHDNRSSTTGYDIYAQNYGSSGIKNWTSNGVLICNATSQQLNARIITSSSSPDFFIAWEDNRNGNTDIYMQKINQLGVVQWTTNGIPIVTSSGIQSKLEMTVDGSGGVIITWVDERSGNRDIYAQRINASGVIQWATNGVPVCTAIDRQDNIQIVPDSLGGALIVWEDRRIGWSPDIYGQRLNSSGSNLWASNGIQICPYSSSKISPQIVRSAPASNNFFVAWIDGRSSNDPYYSLIDINGVSITSTNGTPASSTSGANAQNINMISDRIGGAYIAWNGNSVGNYDVYVQRITVFGSVSASWPTTGSQAVNETSDQNLPKMATCDDELIVVFQDWRNPCPSGTCLDLFYQSINTATGSLNGTINGVPLATNFYNQKNHKVAIMHSNVVATWEDERRRPSDGCDIYCSPINVTCTNYVNSNAKSTNTSSIINTKKTTDGYLAQNIPNPFSNNTEIKYQLPKGTQTAMLGIYDLNGSQVKMYPINAQNNSGSVSVQAQELKAGMYVYTLIIDGKAFDSKKMVLTAE